MPVASTANSLASAGAGAAASPTPPFNDEERTSTPAAAAAKAANAAARKARAARDAGAPGAAAKPVTVSLTFDDQRISQILARDALKANGRAFKATFFVASAFINNLPGEAPGRHPQSLSLAQLEALEDDGHEIGVHTRTHADLPTLSAAQQRDEICGAREDLVALGLGATQPIVSFAYPYGDYDAAIEGIVASCGFTSARTVQQGPEFIPPVDAFATATTSRGGSLTNTDDLASVKNLVTSAVAGRWVQLVFHDIANAQFVPIDQYSQTLQDFNALLDFLQVEQASGRVVVKTVGDVIRGSSCTPVTCAAQGKNCGTISDGCGAMLSCGMCPSGQTCSTNNVCVANSDAPQLSLAVTLPQFFPSRAQNAAAPSGVQVPTLHAASDTLGALAAPDPGLLLEYSRPSVAPGATERLLVRVYAHCPALDCNDQPAPGMTGASSHTKPLDGRAKRMVGAVQVAVPVLARARLP